MANVQISIDRQTKSGPRTRLPLVCVRCGERAVLLKELQFSWAPALASLLILTGLPGILIVILVLVKRARLKLPFCEKHRNPGYWREILHYGGLSVFGLLFVAAVVWLALTSRSQGPEVDWAGLICVGVGVLALLWLIGIIILEMYTIRAGEITDDSVTLTAVSPRFRDAVKARRSPPVVLPVEEAPLPMAEVDSEDDVK